ncbi:MAG: DUF2905 domain-containing protein [Thermodesulfovibrionales bacterium]|nr:DUF2905 domain-containing protein [Thermodesulfovibrionales bacterium]
MPDSMHSIGKMLIFTGIVVVAMGGLLMLMGKFSWFGKLPGDIVIQKKNFTFYFPLATSILLSVILSLIFWIFGKR